MTLKELETEKRKEVEEKKDRVRFLYRQIGTCMKEIDDIKHYLTSSGIGYRGMQVDVLIETLKGFGDWTRAEKLGLTSGISGRLVFTLLEPSVNHGRVLKENRDGRVYYMLEPDEEKRKAIEHKMKRGPYETRKKKLLAKEPSE